MLSWINPKIDIGDAGAKGKGLFAKQPVTKDEIIFAQGGRVVDEPTLDGLYSSFAAICIPVERNLYLVPPQPDMDMREAGFYINHSCNPNCGPRGQITFAALRDIQAGEELAYDYAMTDTDSDDMECLCGDKNCRKIITADDWRDKDLQEKYRGHFSCYIQRMIDAQSA